MGTRTAKWSGFLISVAFSLAMTGMEIHPASAANDPPPAISANEAAVSEEQEDSPAEYNAAAKAQDEQAAVVQATEEQNAVDPSGPSLAQAPNPPAAGGGAPAPPPELPETEVVAQPQAGPATNNNYNEVTGPSILQGTLFSSPPVNGYNANTSTVGTMTNTSVLQFPGTISTVTRDTIRDQQVLSMDELLRDVSGAVKAYGNDGVIRPDQFFVRGFEADARTFRRDGYLDWTYMPRDVANIERVDVLQGPSSVLYGAALPTGTFNITTKRAQQDVFAWGGFTTGSYGLQRYAVDVNTPLNKDATILFRINAAYQNSNSFIQDVFYERTFVAPTMTFVLDDDTSFTWSGEYQHDHFRMYNGIPAINGNPFAINRNTFAGDPNGDIAYYTQWRNTMTFEKILSDNWTMRVGEMSLFYNTPSTTTVLDNGTLNTNGLIADPTLGRDQSIANPFVEQNHDVMESLAGEFDTGPVAHHALLGAEQDWFITNHDAFTTTAGPGVFVPGLPLSAYGAQNIAGGGPFPLGPQNPGSITSVFDNPSFRQNRFGFFGQDIIDVTDRLHFTLGARFDYMNQEFARTLTFAGSQVIPPLHTFDTFHQFSPRAGITYDLIPETMSAYAMFSHSFAPSVGAVNFTNTGLLPQVGNIWEGGIKTKLSDNFLLTTGGYWIKEQNVNVEQQNQTGIGPPFLVTQAGMQRSQGLETSLTGNLTERLSTISNFSYNDSFLYNIAQPTVDQTAPLAQSRVRGIPHWLGNLWLRYNFIQEQRRTIGMALGMRYVGQRLGDYSAQLLQLPSYNIWDLGFYYTRGNLNGMILWDNIFNTNYAVTSISQYQVFPGTPSNVRVQMSYMF